MAAGVVSGVPASSDRITTCTRRVAGPIVSPAIAARVASAALASPLEISRVMPPTARDAVRVSPASGFMPTLRSFLADH